MGLRRFWPCLSAVAVLLTGCPSKSGDDDDAATTPPACVESWVCSPWMTNGVDDNGTRTCVDANACGTTVDKPVDAAVLPALDYDFYECNVEPIFDAKCAQLGCHGTESGRGLRTYARGKLRITGETWTEPGCLQAGTTHPSEECIGSIECRCWTLPHSAAEWRRNYDAARGFGLTAAGTPIASSDSELLTQPKVGGLPHAGVHVFTSGDAHYNTIKSWLDGTPLGSTCTTGN